MLLSHVTTHLKKQMDIIFIDTSIFESNNFLESKRIREVYKLAEYLKIDNALIEAKPTDGLWDDNRTDEDQIGASYDEIEWAMKQKKLGKKLSDFDGREKEVFEVFEKHQNNNLHKMKPIPVCKIPNKLK